MANAPRRNYDVTAIPATRLAVYAANGDFPTRSDEQPHWHCLEISNGAGVVPTCELVRDLAAAGTRLRNIRLDGQANWIVEVWRLDSRGSRHSRLFVGEVIETQFALDKNSEHESATATIPHWWFGSIARGQEVWNPHTAENVVVHHPLEFNPLIDGKYVANKAVPRSGYSFWIDQESARTETARTFQGVTVEEWTLRDIIDTLCRMLNPNQDFLNNPALDDDWGSDAPAIRNVELPTGRYLIDYLSQLLPAFGYDWFIEPPVDSARPTIKIFPRGVAQTVKVDLYLDDIGETISTSTVESAAVNFNVGNVKNDITLRGSLKQEEFTVPLYRSWPEANDEDEVDEDSLNPVKRKFIANEAGDYTSVRPEISEVPNFGDDYIPKRRKAEDLLRWNDDGIQTARAYPLLQWRDGDTDEWRDVEKNYRVLADEIGVWFTKPPTDLLGADDLQLRLTCTLISDKRVEETYTDNASINGNTVEAIIDARDRFHYRQIKGSGDFASVLAGAADTIDDSGNTMLEYLDPLGEIQKAASVGVAPVLHGIHIDKQIGQLVRQITGRNILLNAIPFGLRERYPQITGIRHTFVPDYRTHISVTPYASQNPDQRVRRRPKA